MAANSGADYTAIEAEFTDRFNAIRYYLCNLGFSIVPIQAGSKCPNIKGWNQPGGYYEPKHIDAALEFFKNHPRHNLGLVHEPSNTAALDIDHNEYTRIAFATLGIDLTEFLTAYPTCSIRGNPEKLAKPIYRVPAGVTLTAKKLSWPHPEGSDPKTGGRRLVTVFELRAGKVQDVLPPSLHPLGVPYSWHTDPEECPIAELPPELIDLWQHWSEYEHDLLTACPWHKPESRRSPEPREHKEASNGVIQAFNQAHDVRELLKKHGYKPKGNNRFVAPGSTSRLPGVKIFDDGRAYSHHGSDPLADGHSHDAFSVFCILDHKGDMRAAVREAAKLLGMDRPQKDAPEPPPWTAEEVPSEAYAEEVSRASDSASHNWQEPLPLVAKVAPEPHPLDALPDTIRAAVEEVQAFTKAPVPLVASSALGALSLAIQAHVDVKRTEKLEGPVSLFLLTIADSGERKTTCDGFFTAAIRQYEQEQVELIKVDLLTYKVAIAAWTAEHEGVLLGIKQAAKTGKPSDALKAKLARLEHEKPQAPRVPTLIHGDETPENLAWSLAREWPSGGVVSSEAGIVLGSHGMGKESVMRNLSLLNILWDGGTLSIGRRTSESFTVRGARLTMALQIQEATLRGFFDRSSGLARGTGFLARFLVSWPDSTQGFRPFTDPPSAWPALAKFHQRIAAILNTPAPIGEDGTLSPSMLTLTPHAKNTWVAFHDAVEKELRTGGELYDVRDVASKSADNATRLAGLFQAFEQGVGGTVNRERFEGASRIVAWHLNESRRFFGELAMPEELVNAVRLDSWLLNYCRCERTQSVPVARVQQYGPSETRRKQPMEEALRELEELDRSRLVREGRRKEIRVNPVLLRDDVP